MTSKKLIIIMGISGSGKSTIGKALSAKMGIPFIDADDFHPNENVMKMSRGVPLEDEDRWPWLGAIIEFVLQSHRNTFILACSALKASYREYLDQRLTNGYLFLELSAQEAEARLNQRAGHFMPAKLVNSQLDALEVPERALSLSATLTVDEIVKEALSYFDDFR